MKLLKLNNVFVIFYDEIDVCICMCVTCDVWKEKGKSNNYRGKYIIKVLIFYNIINWFKYKTFLKITLPHQSYIQVVIQVINAWNW